MNLQQAMEINAGGPGSGCHGDNCGRPIDTHLPPKKRPGVYQYQKTGKTWMMRPSPYKGKFYPDKGGAYSGTTHGNPKEENSFWLHQATPEKGVLVEIHRDIGKKATYVIERELRGYDVTVRYREVRYTTMKRAMKFLNRRYGITLP